MLLNTESGSEVFVFVHLPKTGGHSLREFFRQHPLLDGRFVYLVSQETLDSTRLGMLPSVFQQLPEQERKQVTVLLGHEVTKDTHRLVPGKVPRHIVFLREPAAALVSHYNYHMEQFRLAGKPPVEFEQWYDKSKRNNIRTRWLLRHFMMQPSSIPMTSRDLEKVQATLGTFWFVGCTEHLDRDASLLFQRMGLAGSLRRFNVSGVHHQKVLTLDNPLRERLRADNPLDVQLYEHWQARLDESRARIRAEITAR
jgi:hypothetical protein